MAVRDVGKRRVKHRVPLKALARVATVAAGVQFGWALQLSLLTPYVQELGIPHQFASLIWLCGPISGMFVQPVVGHYSDQCTSSYGRRRPFIVTGAFLVCLSVLLIGFSADLGSFIGDDTTQPFKLRAIILFVIGFWLLDLANNTLQGPCRALLADYTGKDQRRTRRANAFFSLFMAVGNVLGFATGAYDGWYKLLPFTQTDACAIPCANLKSAFLLGTILLVITTILSVTAAQEIPWVPESDPRHPSHAQRAHADPSTPLLSDRPNQEGKVEDPEDDDEDEDQVSEALFWELIVALRDLPRTMWYILLVTALTWLAWFPFLLFDTDWMGREIYLGDPTGSDESPSVKLYYKGVHKGSLGLMLNSVVLGATSLTIDFLCRKIGPSRVWAAGNAIMTICFAGTVVISKWAEKADSAGDPPLSVLIASLVVFAVLGIPLAVTYSVPYALTATYAEKSGGGQGLSMGVLNLAVVIPQVLVSVGSGPFDSIFSSKGGNLPSFLLASASALVGGITAILILPRPPPGFKSTGLRRTRSSPIA